jgi:hypothetical protein
MLYVTQASLDALTKLHNAKPPIDHPIPNSFCALSTWSASIRTKFTWVRKAHWTGRGLPTTSLKGAVFSISDHQVAVYSWRRP